MAKQATAIVIGSGIAGLASACYLASKNYTVQVFEAGATYGGKIAEIKEQGFRFDKGPSLFTLPHLLDEVFVSCNKNPRDYYTYKQLPLITKYFYDDETQLEAFANVDLFIDELVNKHGEDRQRTIDFFEHIKSVYDFVAPIFLENPILEFYKNFPLSIPQSLLKSLQIDAFKSLNKSNQKWFKNPKTIQLFNRFATYNGSNPFLAPATLNVIPHLEHQLGAYYVNGGMRQVANALRQLAVDMGVEFQFKSLVQEVLIEEQQAIGVKVNQEEYLADHIVCNMDINNAYPKLLKKQKQPKIYLKQEKSSSALVFYWSMDIETPQLDVHNILFSSNYKEEFQQLKQGTVYHDPTIYLYISSKADKNDAPLGKENWFTMINVPHDSGQKWEEIIPLAKKNIIKKLNKSLGIDVANCIMNEKILNPKEIEATTSSFGGALYGNSSNSMFAAFLRHPHQNKRIKNLSFVGGSVHPGGGIPLCILSAKIATNVC